MRTTLAWWRRWRPAHRPSLQKISYGKRLYFWVGRKASTEHNTRCPPPWSCVTATSSEPAYHDDLNRAATPNSRGLYSPRNRLIRIAVFRLSFGPALL